ncbi:unnamed protein product [Dimorphilus gyrociliatus]|uniref:RING-type domain-containing protein n=1 Tax=Dimorphilus gyrociliatus TaxID=2664684 RepID=A0A7I8VCC2_9ANNE|nr:unnamed protein product [Dimorphilus gyrociliatus]
MEKIVKIGYTIKNAEVECTICTKSWVDNDPRMLPCQHTFCYHCLDELQENSMSTKILQCPACRAKYPWPDEGTSGFPKNRFATALEENTIFYCSRHPLNKSIERPIVCKDCKQKRLCLECLLEHRTCDLASHDDHIVEQTAIVDKYSRKADDLEKRFKENRSILVNRVEEVTASVIDIIRHQSNDILKDIDQHFRLNANLLKAFRECLKKEFLTNELLGNRLSEICNRSIEFVELFDPSFNTSYLGRINVAESRFTAVKFWKEKEFQAQSNLLTYYNDDLLVDVTSHEDKEKYVIKDVLTGTILHEEKNEIIDIFIIHSSTFYFVSNSVISKFQLDSSDREIINGLIDVVKITGNKINDETDILGVLCAGEDDSTQQTLALLMDDEIRWLRTLESGLEILSFCILNIGDLLCLTNSKTIERYCAETGNQLQQTSENISLFGNISSWSFGGFLLLEKESNKIKHFNDNFILISTIEIEDLNEDVDYIQTSLNGKILIGVKGKGSILYSSYSY